MSKRLFDADLIGRIDEVKLLNSSLSAATKNSVLIRVFGDSGCGKTFFVKKAVGGAINQRNVYACYVDIDSDEMTATSLFELLTYFSWNAQGWDDERILSIPHKMSYSDFIKKQKVNAQVQNNILSALKNSLSLVPTYGDIVKNLIHTETVSSDFSNQQVEDIFFAYIKRIASKCRVILILDNYQFINTRLQKRIEARFGEIKKNVALIIVERTKEGKEDAPDFLCYKTAQTHIRLQKFDAVQTKEYIVSVLPECTVDMADHFYRITQGNPKELELAVLNYQQGSHDNKNFIVNSRNLIETIHMLPDVEKYVIIMTSLFPSGMKLSYATDIIKQHLIITSEDDILANINSLKLFGYIIVNSTSGDLLKPAHEKIVTSARKLISNEDYLEIYNNLLLSIEEIIMSKEINKNELYLLNCLIGLFTANQLREKIGYVIRAITINYQQCLYNYVNLLYPEIKEVISVLPEDCVIKILDSFQKTSNFYNGLELISSLQDTSKLTPKHRIFYAKFLTQTYQFDDALSTLKEVDDSDAAILCKINIYQHLSNDAEARRLLSVLFKNNENQDLFSDDYYVILRNTAHYFPYEKAVSNLIQVHEYFKRKGFLFGEATANNNLGVVHLWSGDLNGAKRALQKANNIFENINSNEIFESQINLGVLAYLESDYHSAVKHMETAEDYVPKTLWMDVLIIQVNKMLFQIAEGTMSPDTAFSHMHKMCQKVNACPDPWVKFQVIYNATAVAKLLGKNSLEEPDRGIEMALNSKEYTRFDVIAPLHYKNIVVDISLSLSPNWRY